MKKIYYSKDLGEQFLVNLKNELRRVFKNCRKIAIKIHFGEPGNKSAFKPRDIKPVTDLLKELNIDFSLYDSSVTYNSLRSNSFSHRKYAIDKGWGELGEINTEDNFIVVKGKRMNYEVSKFLADADGVLVISHFKGHYCCGFGGAIKNLGMGALSKKSKSNIHSGGEPVIIGKCTKCKNCERACPINGIVVLDEPKFEKCYGCSNCIYSCKNKVLKPKVDFFDYLLADGANAAQSKFKKVYYVSYLKNISKFCDCERDAKDIISGDVGFLSGENAVAIDMASRDLIIKKTGEDIFLKHNKKSGIEQIKAAESLGMGSLRYGLVEIK